MLFATAACNFSTSELQKVLPDPQFFLHVHFQMRFSPQWRAIFSTSELQKVLPDPQCFLAFSLPNALLATAACNFSTSELQKVLPDPQFFSIFTSKCASLHSSVQFLISPLTTWLRTRRFNRPTFRLIRTHESFEKTQMHLLSSDFRAIASSFCSTLLFNCPYCRKFAI